MTACGVCTEPLGAGMLICPRCGTRIRGSTGPATGPLPASGSLPAPAAVWQLRPAGFWRRCAAFMIDLLALLPAVFVVQLLVPIFAGVIVWWLYFSSFETSRWHATPGKRVMGLHVTDVNGVHLRFGRSSLRFFGKLVSAAPLFCGFLLAAFTRDKQALHDLIASTLVLHRQ